MSDHDPLCEGRPGEGGKYCICGALREARAGEREQADSLIKEAMALLRDREVLITDYDFGRWSDRHLALVISWQKRQQQQCLAEERR